MKEYIKLVPREKNVQKRDMFLSYRSNSQYHYKDISNFNYDHRIKLNPTGERKTMDIRSQISNSHIHDSYIKSDYSIISPKNRNKTAYEKADFQSKINFFIKAQKYQNLLENEKDIKKLCKDKNIEKKKLFNKKKIN